MSVSFQCLIGTHNHGLGEAEQKRYAIFSTPSFAELYAGKYFIQQEVLQSNDLRSLEAGLRTGNILYFECLFSCEIRIRNEKIRKLLDLRAELAKANLPMTYQLTSARAQQLQWEVTQARVCQQSPYEYDRKKLMEAYRLFDFLERFGQRQFEDFEGAIRYGEDAYNRGFYEDLRQNVFSFEEVSTILVRKMRSVEQEWKDWYFLEDENKSVQAKMSEIIQNIVLEDINFENKARKVRG